MRLVVTEIYLVTDQGEIPHKVSPHCNFLPGDTLNVTFKHPFRDRSRTGEELVLVTRNRPIADVSFGEYVKAKWEKWTQRK